MNPQSLLKYNLSVSEIATKVRQNNQNIGASFITKGKEEYLIRSVGLAQNVADLENIVVSHDLGTPVKNPSGRIVLVPSDL